MISVYYLAIALRKAMESDNEVDFILDGLSYVVQAIEIIPSPEAIASVHDSMMQYYPECRIMVTHTPLLESLTWGAELQNIEQDMIGVGIAPSNKRNDRISKAFG